MLRTKFPRLLVYYTKFKKILDKSALFTMYYSLVFPYFLYCIKIWNNASAVYIDALIKYRKNVFTQNYFLSF